MEGHRVLALSRPALPFLHRVSHAVVDVASLTAGAPDRVPPQRDATTAERGAYPSSYVGSVRLVAVGSEHTHLHASGGRASRRVRLALALSLAPFLVATVIGLVAFWPAHQRHRAVGEVAGPPVQLVHGTVESLTSKRCQPDQNVCSDVRVRLTSGPDRGSTTYLRNVEFGPGTPTITPGDRIVLGRDDSGGQVTYYFADFQRGPPLVLLAVLFAVLAVAIARWRGAAALAGLAVAWLLLVRFVLPALVEGKSPLGVALTASAAMMLVVLYVAHGLNARTTTALLGTLVSLALTGLLASIFVTATHLVGVASDETAALQTVLGNLDFRGLLLAGILIGSLGVLNDVTVTQASVVWELHHANPARGAIDVFRSGMRVGRDHIASTIYTLVLAYAGAALPLLILFTLTTRHVTDVLTGETVAEEIGRTLVGSIGLIASVPITTALAAFIVTRRDAITEDENTEGPSPQTQPSTPLGARINRRLTALNDRARRRVRPPKRSRAHVEPPPQPWEPPKREQEFWDPD